MPKRSSLVIENRPASFGDVTLDSTSWAATDKLSYEDWLKQGSQLGMIGRNVGWWIGDWLRYGTNRWGEKYTDAINITGYARQTLTNMVWCATQIPADRRREDLSFSHHMYVASYSVKEQNRWLALAAKEEWSIERLRTEVKASRGLEPHQDARTGTENEQRAVRAAETRAGTPGLSTDAQATIVRREPEAEASEHIFCPNCGHKITL